MQAGTRAGIALMTMLFVGLPSSAAALRFAQPAGSPYPTTNPPFTPALIQYLGGAAVGDFNGDGISDVAVVNRTGLPVFNSGESVTVLLGNREGGLTIAPGSPLSIYSGGELSAGEAIATADFNGDGKLDLAVVDQIHGTVVILFGDGSGRFHPYGTPIPFSNPGPTSTQSTSITTGDFKGDGHQDIALVNSHLTVLLGNGSGGFTPAAGSPLALPGFPTSVVAGDFTGDGRSDLAVANRAGYVSVYLSSKDGTLTEAPGSPLITDKGPGAIAAADLNADGKVDLVTTNESSGNVTVLMGQGGGRFSPASGSPFAVPPGENSPTLIPGPTYLVSPRSVAVGELACDGKLDLAVASWSGSNENLAILQGDGNGNFTNAIGSPFPANGSPGPVLVGDFNGDGTPDLAVANAYLGAVTVLQNESCKSQPVSRAQWLALLASELLHSTRTARTASLLKRGRLELRFQALGAGTAVIDWYVPRGSGKRVRTTQAKRVLLASGRLTFSRAGTRIMRITLTTTGRHMLKRRVHTAVTASGTFTPSGRAPITAVRTFVLKP
jgi:hypothetical protein